MQHARTRLEGCLPGCLLQTRSVRGRRHRLGLGSSNGRWVVPSLQSRFRVRSQPPARHVGQKKKTHRDMPPHCPLFSPARVRSSTLTHLPLSRPRETDGRTRTRTRTRTSTQLRTWVRAARQTCHGVGRDQRTAHSTQHTLSMQRDTGGHSPLLYHNPSSHQVISPRSARRRITRSDASNGKQWAKKKTGPCRISLGRAEKQLAITSCSAWATHLGFPIPIPDSTASPGCTKKNNQAGEGEGFTTHYERGSRGIRAFPFERLSEDAASPSPTTNSNATQAQITTAIAISLRTSRAALLRQTRRARPLGTFAPRSAAPRSACCACRQRAASRARKGLRSFVRSFIRSFARPAPESARCDAGF